MSRKITALFLAGLMICFVFAACNKEAGLPDGDGNAPSEKESMVIALNQIIQSLDPCTKTANRTMMACNQMAETLLWRNAGGTFTGLLAETYEQVDDVTYRLNIRRGVKFHNGEKLKAGDVVFSWKRACSTVQSNVNIGSLWNADACYAEGDYTVILETKEPCAMAYISLSHGQGVILNEKHVTEIGDEAAAFNMVGTGPYMQDGSWIIGEDLKMTRFDGYWGEKAKIKDILIKGVDNTNARVNMLLAGEADLIMNAEREFWEVVEENENCELVHGWNLGVKWLAMGYWSQSLKNDDVRKAVAYCIDVPAIAKEVYKGAAEPATSWLPKDISGWTDDLETYPYNPEKAMELLEIAGYENGVDIDFTYMNDTYRRNIAGMCRDFGADVGMNFVLNEMQSPVWAEAASTFAYEIGMFSNSNGNADGDALYGPFHTEPGSAVTQNRCMWSNAEADKLLEDSRKEFDPAKRTEIFVKVQQIQAEYPAVYPLVYEEETYAAAVNLKGFEPVGWNMYQMSKWYFN